MHVYRRRRKKEINNIYCFVSNQDSITRLFTLFTINALSICVLYSCNQPKNAPMLPASHFTSWIFVHWYVLNHGSLRISFAEDRLLGSKCKSFAMSPSGKRDSITPGTHGPKSSMTRHLCLPFGPQMSNSSSNFIKRGLESSDAKTLMTRHSWLLSRSTGSDTQIFIAT